MGCDPRQKAGAQQEKSQFFRTLGKVGDIEALNSVNGEIGQGLRALETISNQLRTGDGPVAKIWSDTETSIEAGADAVMGTVGIDPNAARDVGSRFNPGVLNRAQGQAEAIYERVRQGNFEIRDVPEAIQDFGNLGQLLGGVFTPRQSQDDNAIRQARPACPPSHWASDLIAYAPKHKFMFVVEFVFNSNYAEFFNSLEFAFVVKRSNRPVINFEYEDINYYNFRTKVLKRMEYQPIQMTFYDDMKDNALRFYNRYLQIISPISRGDSQRPLFEESGMTFDQNNGANSSSINAIGDTTHTIIHHINLYHIINGGHNIDLYRFESPRLQSMQLDDLDMTDGSTGTEVTIEFNYDRMNLLANEDIRDYRTQVEGASDGGGGPDGGYAIDLKNFNGDKPNTTPDSEPLHAVYGDSSSSSTATQQTPQDAARQRGREATLNSNNQAIQNTRRATGEAATANVTDLQEQAQDNISNSRSFL